MSERLTWRGPRGHLEPLWYSRDEALVTFIADRRTPVLDESFFQKAIPAWRARGVDVRIEPTYGSRRAA